MTHKIITGVLAVLALLFGGTQLFGAPSGPAHYQKESFLEGLTAGQRDQLSISRNGVLTIGANGSAVTEFKATTCDIVSASVTASTSGYAYCAVTGVASGDVVIAQLSTTTANAPFGGWVIQSAKASSTAGMVDLRLYNGTGANAVPSATSVGSSTNILYVDN